MQTERRIDSERSHVESLRAESERIPFHAGDNNLVDMTGDLRAHATSPDALREFLDRGVENWSSSMSFAK